MTPDQNLVPVDFVRQYADFLQKPFTGYEYAQLPCKPDKEFLMWLPGLKDEAGIIFVSDEWFLIKGSDIGIARFGINRFGSPRLFLHSHTSESESPSIRDAMPSAGDYLNCEGRKNLIVSSYGITEYWPIKGLEHKNRLEAVVMRGSFGSSSTLEEYDTFLADIGAEHIIYPWSDISQSVLDGMLAS